MRLYNNPNDFNRRRKSKYFIRDKLQTLVRFSAIRYAREWYKKGEMQQILKMQILYKN